MSVPFGRLVGIAARSAWRRRGRTLLAALVIALGNLVMVFQLAQGAGQSRAFLDGMIRSLSGHLQLRTVSPEESELLGAADPSDLEPIARLEALEELLHDDPRVVETTRRIRFGAMMSVEDESWGAFVLGVEPATERAVCDAIELAEGRFLASDDADPMPLEIVISESVAEARDLALGDSVILLTSTVGGSMNAMELEIVGLLSSGGLSRFYSSIAYVPISVARRIIALEDGEAYELVVLLDDEELAEATAADLRQDLAAGDFPVQVETWRDTGALFRGILKVSGGFRLVMAVFLGAVISLLVFNTLTVYVLERDWEVATLSALGFRPGWIATLFVLEGVAIAAVSSAVGLLLGGALSLWLGSVGIPAFNEPMEYVFAGSRLFPILKPGHVLGLFAGSALVAFLASIGPALRAARLDPSRALNQEAT